MTNQDLDLGAIERHYDNLTADYRIERVQAVANYVRPLVAEVRRLKVELAQTVSIEYLTAREEALLAEIARLTTTLECANARLGESRATVQELRAQLQPYVKEGIEFCAVCGMALGDEDDVTWEDEGS